MLNRAEFNQLQSRMLSHMARSMYVFYIQPQARQGHSIIDPIDLSNKLISNSMAMPCSPTIYDIEAALNELEQNGLIRRLNPNLPWQNASIVLPLFARELANVPQPPFRMFASWEPGPGFKDTALLAGLAEFSYRDHELRTFINYWMTTTSEQTQSSWERAFIKRLLKMRSAAEMSSLRPNRRSYNRDYSQRDNRRSNSKYSPARSQDKFARPNDAYMNYGNNRGAGFGNTAAGGFDKAVGAGFDHGRGAGFDKAVGAGLDYGRGVGFSNAASRDFGNGAEDGMVKNRDGSYGNGQALRFGAGQDGQRGFSNYQGSGMDAPALNGYQSQFNGQNFDADIYQNPADEMNGSLQSVPIHSAQHTTSSLTRRVTLKGMMTGKEDYDLTAPGYTEDQLRPNHEPRGYETYTAAQGYSDPNAPSPTQFQNQINFGSPDGFAPPIPQGPASFNQGSAMPPLQEGMMFGDPSSMQGQNFDSDFGNQPSQFNGDFIKELAKEFGSNSAYTHDPSMEQSQQLPQQPQQPQQSLLQPQQPHTQSQHQPPLPHIQSQPQQSTLKSQDQTEAEDNEDVPFYNQDPQARKDKAPAAPSVYIPVDRTKLKLD